MLVAQYDVYVASIGHVLISIYTVIAVRTMQMHN